MKIKLPNDIVEVVKNALNEDIKDGDVTADLVPENGQAEAVVICREHAVICGKAWFDEVFLQLGNVEVEWFVGDGDSVKPEQEICRLQGSARHILTGERTALNFLQSLSGTATITNDYAQLIMDTKTKILDTRKTIPGLRLAQKYAVACGGGKNHRIGLYDAILIKENHIMAAGSIAKAVENAREIHPHIPVEVEVENMDELQQVLDTAANSVLLDNFSNKYLLAAVKLVGGRIKTEASGGIESESILEVAKCGVDYISVGALTKNIRAVDFSMRFFAKM